MKVLIRQEEDTLQIVNDQGEVSRRYMLLFTYDSDREDRRYAVYTDESEDEQGNMRVFAIAYDPGSFQAEELTDEEHAMIDDMVKEIMEELEEEETPETEEDAGELTSFVRQLMDQYGEDVGPDDMP